MVLSKVQHNVNPVKHNQNIISSQSPPVPRNMMNNRFMLFTGTFVSISIIVAILYSQGIIGSPEPNLPNSASISNGSSMTFAPSTTTSPNSSTNKPITESTTKPTTKPTTEPISEPITEPVSEPIAEPVSEPLPPKRNKLGEGNDNAINDVSMITTTDKLKYTEYKKNNHGLVHAYIINGATSGTTTNKVNGLHNIYPPVSDNVPPVCAKLCNDNIECNRISYKPNGTSCFFWQGGESALPKNTPFNLYVKPS